MAKVLLSFLALMIIAGTASASNFGSTAKYSYAEITDERAEFTLLLWSSDMSQQLITLGIKKFPENFTVFLEKNKIVLNSIESGELVSTGNGFIPATSVKVFAVPQNSVPGSYNILVSARSSAVSDEIAFSQERIFNLTVNVIGENITNTAESHKNIIYIDIPPVQPADEEENFHIYAIALIMIAFISFLIYRYS